MTRGVQTLLGSPKQAIIKLSVPMMIGMFVQTIYQIADGIWVAGLGPDALAAVGLFFPFFIVLMAIGGGIGIGGSSAVSRRIGEDDKAEAEKTAIHTILIGLMAGIVIGFALIPFLDTIFIGISGDEAVGGMAADYATILFSGSVFIIFFNIANAILRGEGDARRAMYGLIVGAALNIVLDPLFIYVFGFGVIGAGIATLVSMIVSSLVFSYWLFFKRITYLHIVFRKFRFEKRIIGEILRVGIPASLSQISMAGMMVVLNRIIIIAGGTDGVAVFTSGWRVVMLGIIPLIGLGTGVTAVTGAAFGQRDREKLSTAYLYAVKIGVLIELGIAVLVFIFAPQISFIFTYSEEAARITEDLIEFLRIVSGFYPTVPLGMLTAAMLRGIGKGVQSLLVMLVRILVFQIPAAFLLGIVFGLGLTGVWIGFVGGNILAVAGIFTWGRIQTSRLSFPLATLKE